MPGKLSEVARHLVLPDGIVSTGWPAVRDTCARLKVGFDGWQDGLGRAILAKREDGLYAADTAVVSIPRQVGKTYLIGWIVFALCIIRPGTTVIWTAHRFKTARETFMSLKSAALRKAMAPHVDPDQIYSGSGNESILFRNGSRILFGARERGFGRGFSAVDVLVLDEAQILSEGAMEDMVPTTNTSPNPLILLTGTPPRPIDPGEVFTNLRTEALAGESEGVLYVEFSADEGADPSDWSQVAKANPSYPDRTSARAILRMKKNLGPESFMREGLGVWDAAGAKVFGSAWGDCYRPEGPRPPLAAVGLAATLGGAWASLVGAAAVDGGRRYVIRPLHHEARVAWVVPRCVSLGVPVVVDARGPAAPLIEHLKAAKVEVIEANTGDVLNDCDHFEQLVREVRIEHANYPELEEAVAGATKRDVGDRWAWGRRKSTANIAPLEAATLAVGHLYRPEFVSVYEDRGVMVL